MRSVASLALGIALLSGPGLARAEQPRQHILLGTIEISGRIQKPLASLEINRIEPKLTLSELRPSFTDRIGGAIARDPY